MPSESCNLKGKPFWKIKLLAICLIVFFGGGSVLTILALLVLLVEGNNLPGLMLNAVFAMAINIGFLIGRIGLLKLKSWSLWLTVGLCGTSILHLLWQIITTFTSETATKQNEIVSYIIAGFYLAIAFFLTSDSSRKLFRHKSETPLE